MSFNGSGTYVPPAGQPVATGTVIQSSSFNTLVTDIGNTFNNVLPRDGQASMAGQLKLIDGTSSVPGIAFNSEGSTGIFRPSTGIMALSVSGVENLRLNSSGRVLIGTTADDGANKLQVNGSAKISGSFAITGSLNTTGTSTATSFNGPLNGNVTGNVSGTSANVTGIVAVANGGTGASTAAAAVANLGLGNVSNTSDANKPLSNADVAALGLKANLAGPTFTGAVAVGGSFTIASVASNIATVGADTVGGSYITIRKGGTSNPVGYLGTDGGGINSGGSGANFGVRAEADLMIMAGATERARMLSAGRMLIGTTADDGINKLQVNGNLAAIDGALVTTSTSTNVNARNFSFGQTAAFGRLDLNVSAVKGGDPTTAGVPLISMNSAGRVMIGSTVDDGVNTLQVNGTIAASSKAMVGLTTTPRKFAVGGSQYADMVLKSNVASGAVGGSTLYFGNNTVDGMGWLDYNHSLNSLAFATNASEAMRIASSGNVLVGTTTDDGVNKFQVSGTIKGGSLRATLGTLGSYAASTYFVQPELASTTRSYACGGDVNTYGTLETYVAKSNGVPVLVSTHSTGGLAVQQTVSALSFTSQTLAVGSTASDHYAYRTGGNGGSDSIQQGANLTLGGSGNGVTLQLGGTTGNLGVFTYNGSTWNRPLVVAPTYMQVAVNNTQPLTLSNLAVNGSSTSGEVP